MSDNWVSDDADHSKCRASSNIADVLTFGRGRLDDLGFWEIPCYHCARKHEREHPEHGECWPHTPEQRKKWQKMFDRLGVK